MKPDHLIRSGTLALTLAVACGFTGCNDHRAAAEKHPDNQRMVSEAWIPEPARQSIVEHAGDAEIKTISTSTRADGTVVYQATLKRGEDHSILTVEGDGRVVSERPIPRPAPIVRSANETTRPVLLEALPEPARKTVLSHVKAEEITRIEQSQLNDRTVYDVVADHAGATTRLCVDADGKVVTGEQVAVTASEDRVAIDRIPERPRTVILEQTRGAAIRDIHADTIDGKVVYTVQVDRNEYINDLIIDRDGNLLAKMRLEHRLAVGDVPAAPRTALVQMADTGTIRVVERASDEGRELYTAVVDKGGSVCRITVDRLGYLVSRRKVEKLLQREDLINPAAAAVREHAHGREVESVEQQNESGRIFYEVRLASPELTAVRVTETGEVVRR
jgi:uncharacterized membrane protein YkoI